jgi:DNA-binding NarL/FixJ family response regulator
MAKIRVVLADDHRAVLDRVRRTLADGFEVVAMAEDGNQAVAAVLKLDPDVLVTDISMPLLDGLQLAKRLQAAHCRTKIVFLTVHEDQDFVTAAFDAGASGYVTKLRLTIDLVPAIREALLGHTFVSRTVAN